MTRSEHIRALLEEYAQQRARNESDLSRRISEIGPIIYHPDIVVTHAWHRDSAHSFMATVRHLRSTIQYFAKWGLKW